MSTVVILTLMIHTFRSQLVCENGYTCYQDSIGNNIVWVMKDDGNVHGPTCEKVCSDALLHNNNLFYCDSNQPIIYDNSSFNYIAAGLDFVCINIYENSIAETYGLKGMCWDGVTPNGKGLIYVTMDTTSISPKQCYFPKYNTSTPTAVDCNNDPGNNNCYGERFSLICPCKSPDTVYQTQIILLMNCASNAENITEQIQSTLESLILEQEFDCSITVEVTIDGKCKYTINTKATFKTQEEAYRLVAYANNDSLSTDFANKLETEVPEVDDIDVQLTQPATVIVIQNNETIATENNLIFVYIIVAASAVLCCCGLLISFLWYKRKSVEKDILNKQLELEKMKVMSLESTNINNKVIENKNGKQVVASKHNIVAQGESDNEDMYGTGFGHVDINTPNNDNNEVYDNTTEGHV